MRTKPKKYRKKWGTLLSMMDHSCNPRKKGRIKGGTKRWKEGARRQMGSLDIGRHHILSHTLKTETSVLPSDLKLGIYGLRSWERSLRWARPTMKHVYYKPSTLHFIFQRTMAAIEQSMDLDFTEFGLLCGKRGVKEDWWGAHWPVSVIFSCPVYVLN